MLLNEHGGSVVPFLKRLGRSAFVIDQNNKLSQRKDAADDKLFSGRKSDRQNHIPGELIGVSNGNQAHSIVGTKRKRCQNAGSDHGGLDNKITLKINGESK